jgi:2-polyprenyl-6-methoxyphenol hydroxylase-like FAD-dependent oxidoreductase
VNVDTPVLIVGGGPVGLALALDLGMRGDRSTILEKDERTGAQLLAKAGTLNERTMEICRRWGVLESVAREGFPDDFNMDTVYCTGMEELFIGLDPRPCARERTLPAGAREMLRKCPQFKFDPILAAAVGKLDRTTLLYGHQFVSLDQDDEGVTAEVVTAGGTRKTLRASFLVACDGAGSTVRSALGLRFDGKLLSYSVSAMIRATGLSKTRMGLANRYMFIDETGTWANLTAVDGRELWRFTLIGSENKLDPGVHDIRRDIDRALGDRVPFEVLRVMPWRRSQCVVERYRAGRVLFGGDAAHTTSPTGGHGLNTGIGDAVSLGWMLHAVLRGQGGPALLEAYEMERRPVAIRNSNISTANFAAWVGAANFDQVRDETPQGEAARDRIGARLSASLQQEWSSSGIALGYRYENSPIVVPDGSPETPDLVSEVIQTSRPGHRAPHIWMADGRSTIDLFGDGFVLLRFDPAVDPSAVESAMRRRGITFRVISIDDAAIAQLYERKLVLVRPDGHVAWRGDDAPVDADGLVVTVCGLSPSSVRPPLRLGDGMS